MGPIHPRPCCVCWSGGLSVGRMRLGRGGISPMGVQPVGSLRWWSTSKASVEKVDKMCQSNISS